jgi:hypothetical protein
LQTSIDVEALRKLKELHGHTLEAVPHLFTVEEDVALNNPGSIVDLAIASQTRGEPIKSLTMST